ncbi:discoidin domain-containing protein, partial [Nevskia soli]|uniref:discoidin domain-containing protein n=1 Tax=Nevskia soli TaxID=418856 RepID=UPI0015D85E3C
MLKFALFFTALTPVLAQTGAVTVDIHSGHVTNTFSPMLALGAGVDGVPTGTVNNVYTSTNIPQMLSAGFGPLTYRLYTELSVQDWHWNPEGTYSGPGQSGYWISSATSTQPIAHTHGFNLPRSGFTFDQGTSSGYSRVDDGDPTTFWKSNPYLSHTYTNDPDADHPQWIMFDLGSKQPVNAIQINWANPYATQYKIQYWTGPDPLYTDNEGNWITLPNGT